MVAIDILNPLNKKMLIALSMALKLNWKVTKLVTTTDLPSSGRVLWKLHLFQRRFSPGIQRLEEKIDIP